MKYTSNFNLKKPERGANADSADINDLNDNFDILDEAIFEGSKKTIETTYSQLKTLRDNSQLVPGQQYRITDFATIINGDVTVSGTTKTLYRSANHPFDIIVTADSVNTLNENARAIQHAGDTYFASSNLKAWQLKYCLDNDTTRFAWASSSGKGIIFWMKDERENECGYDFKNIQMKRHKITAVDLTSLDVFSSGTINTKYQTSCINYLVGFYYGTPMSRAFTGSTNYVKDNIITVSDSDFKWVYTFNNTTNNYSTCVDYSLNNAKCAHNKIKALGPQNILYLSLSGYILSSEINAGDVYDMTFGNNSYYNLIGSYNRHMIFGASCRYNFIESANSGNIFIDNYSGNRLGEGNTNNIFLYSSVNNVYGSANQNNIWSLDLANIGSGNQYVQTGDDCDNWFMGNGNAYIQTDDNCESCFFGNNCGGSVANSIKMGSECKGNFFKGYNRAITLGNKIEMCEFGKYARAISMPNTSTNVYGHIVIPSSCGNKTFNQGCNYIVLSNSDTVTRTYTSADNNKCTSNATNVNVTIPTTGWTLNSTTQVYSQTITVTSMYAAYQGAKDVDFVRPTKNASYLTNLETIQEQMDNITDIESGNGSITVYIKEVPTLAFQIILYGL